MFEDNLTLIEQHAIEDDDFRVRFRLIDLLVSRNFVDQNAKMKQMKRSLLLLISRHRRKIYVLYNLDNINKIQLVIAYVRKH